MDEGEAGVALWYWRYHWMKYDILDDEEEAAQMAAGMVDAQAGSPAGVQFPDGRLIPREEWPAYAEAQERLEAAQRAAKKPEPRAWRKITAPFGGGEIEIDAGEPPWLGVPAR